MAVLTALLWRFHNAATGKCFPSYEAIAEAAGSARGTVYEAIRALEQVGVLSWVNRIKRVREYVPRPVRQPGATTLREPGRRQRFQ
jgi:DNA-binding GntR family transcriptional regulator